MFQKEPQIDVTYGKVDELDTVLMIVGLREGLFYFRDLQLSNVAVLLFLPVERPSPLYCDAFGR